MNSIEKVGQSVGHIGGLNIAMGVVTLVAGVVVGVGCIISGGRLIGKSKQIR